MGVKTPNSLFPYVGGKRRLLKELILHTPNFDNISHYVEPCIGAGTYAFYMLANHKDKFKSITLNDLSKEIIILYRTIRDQPEQFIKEAKEFELTMVTEFLNLDKRKLLYLDCRKELNTLCKSIDPTLEEQRRISILFLFVIKSAFSSWFRRNRKNECNIPLGKMPMEIIKEDKILEISYLLQGVELTNTDMMKVDIKPNSYVYCDPPYLSVSKSGVGYFADDHKKPIQDLIYSKLNELDSCKWMMSNSNHPYLRAKYKDYKVLEIGLKQNVQTKTKDRKIIKELLIKNY